jgi:hypothetical protein
VTRRWVFSLVLVLLVVGAIELQAWVFTHMALRLGALRFYPTDLFARMTDQELAAAVRRRPLGWPVDDAPRTAPSEPVCGSAFGDSMTQGAEVASQEAWVQLLSERLRCGVANYAVPAYGLDQSVLRYEQIATQGQFAILGVYVEMLRRSVAASWTFYAPSQPMSVYSVKPYFTLAGDGLSLQSIPQPLTRAAVAAHHAQDYFRRRVATPARFPYTFAVARAAFIRIFRTDDYRGNAEKYFDVADPSASGVLARRLITRFARIAQQRGARPVVVLIPHPQRLMIDSTAEQQFIDELRRRGDLCVIDVKPVLREQARPLGGQLPVEPQGHYTPDGNRLITDAVATGLRECGIGKSDS